MPTTQSQINNQLFGRLTPEQYAELMAAIQPEAPQSSNQAQ